jgi:hypothetical protein
MSPPQHDWRLLADMHKPTDPEQIAVEIRRQHREGLKPRDIAATLRVDMGVVLAALREAVT